MGLLAQEAGSDQERAAIEQLGQRARCRPGGHPERDPRWQPGAAASGTASAESLKSVAAHTPLPVTVESRNFGRYSPRDRARGLLLLCRGAPERRQARRAVGDRPHPARRRAEPDHVLGRRLRCRVRPGPRPARPGPRQPRRPGRRDGRRADDRLLPRRWAPASAVSCLSTPARGPADRATSFSPTPARPDARAWLGAGIDVGARRELSRSRRPGTTPTRWPTSASEAGPRIAASRATSSSSAPPRHPARLAEPGDLTESPSSCHVPATTPPATTTGEIQPAWRLTAARRPGGMTWRVGGPGAEDPGIETGQEPHSRRRAARRRARRGPRLERRRGSPSTSTSARPPPGRSTSRRRSRVRSQPPPIQWWNALSVRRAVRPEVGRDDDRRRLLGRRQAGPCRGTASDGRRNVTRVPRFGPKQRSPCHANGFSMVPQLDRSASPTWSSPGRATIASMSSSRVSVVPSSASLAVPERLPALWASCRSSGPTPGRVHGWCRRSATGTPRRRRRRAGGAFRASPRS